MTSFLDSSHENLIFFSVKGDTEREITGKTGI